MALFRVDFSGRGELADRQQKLAQMLSRLQKISEGITLLSFNFLVYCLILYSYHEVLISLVEYNISVFITNQMTADPGGRVCL